MTYASAAPDITMRRLSATFAARADRLSFSSVLGIVNSTPFQMRRSGRDHHQIVLPRRTFLRGIGAMALPFDAMVPAFGGLSAAVRQSGGSAWTIHQIEHRRVDAEAGGGADGGRRRSRR
jgi:hypothetical protein